MAKLLSEKFSSAKCRGFFLPEKFFLRFGGGCDIRYLPLAVLKPFTDKTYRENDALTVVHASIPFTVFRGNKKSPAICRGFFYESLLLFAFAAILSVEEFQHVVDKFASCLFRYDGKFFVRGNFFAQNFQSRVELSGF